MMAAGRYDAAAVQVAMIGAALAGKDIPPNPHRPPEIEAEKSPERLAAESKVAWELMERSLRERAAEYRREHPDAGGR